MLSDRGLLCVWHVLIRLITDQQWRWLVLVVVVISFGLDSVFLLEVGQGFLTGFLELLLDLLLELTQEFDGLESHLLLVIHELVFVLGSFDVFNL